MCNPLAIVMAVSAVASGAQNRYQANKQEKMMERQEGEQKALTQRQADTRTAATGTSIFDIDAENAGGSDTGLGNTFLTGAGGIGNSQLNLGGANTKLGG